MPSLMLHLIDKFCDSYQEITWSLNNSCILPAGYPSKDFNTSFVCSPNLGGWLNGQDVLRDFLTTTGTALSAPLPFLLIQLGLTILALRPGRSGRIGMGGLTFVGAFYTIAQLGEPIVLRVWSPSGFDLAQAVVLFVNVASAIAMLVLGIRTWGRMRASVPLTG